MQATNVADIDPSDPLAMFAHKWREEYHAMLTRIVVVYTGLEGSLSHARAVGRDNAKKPNQAWNDDDLINDSEDLGRLKKQSEDADIKYHTKVDEDGNPPNNAEKAAQKKLKAEMDMKKKKYEDKLTQARRLNKDNKPGLGFPLTGNYESALASIKEVIRMYINALDSAVSEALPKLTLSADGAKRARRELASIDIDELREVLMQGLAHNKRDPTKYVINIDFSLFNDSAVIASMPDKIKYVAENRLILLTATAKQTLAGYYEVVRRKHNEIILSIASDNANPAAMMRSMNILPLYALKAMRVATAYAAGFIAARIFENAYVNAMTATKPTVPDLKWLVVIYFTFVALFDGAFMLMLWLLQRLQVGNISSNVIKDFMIDTFVANALAMSSLVWMADIVQDRRYFEYQLTAPRAVRVMRQLCFAVSGVHAAVPYFYFTGPFYFHKQLRAEAKAVPA
jgi:hypothetical protein